MCIELFETVSQSARSLGELTESLVGAAGRLRGGLDGALHAESR